MLRLTLAHEYAKNGEKNPSHLFSWEHMLMGSALAAMQCDIIRLITPKKGEQYPECHSLIHFNETTALADWVCQCRISV